MIIQLEIPRPAVFLYNVSIMQKLMVILSNHNYQCRLWDGPIMGAYNVNNMACSTGVF